MTRLRIFLFVCLFLLVGGGAWYYFTGQSDFDQAKKKLKETAQNAVLGAVKPEDAATLAVKAIEMKQGEHGIELWRLKAEWGNVRREGELLELEKPNFTYHMPPDNTELRVVSEQGEVSQTAKTIRFVRSVIVTQGNDTLKASLMVYNGTSKKLLFPEGASFTGRGTSGTAADVVWRLNDRVIDASGGVDMTWERDADPMPLSKAERQNDMEPLHNSTVRALPPAVP